MSFFPRAGSSSSRAITPRAFVWRTWASASMSFAARLVSLVIGASMSAELGQSPFGDIALGFREGSHGVVVGQDV